MLSSATAQRRMQVLIRILQHSRPKINSNLLKAYSTKSAVSIGDVSKSIKKTDNPVYVPCKYFRDDNGQSTLHHLKWMLQKDILAQDMFLIGAPGSKRRNVAMQYLELTNRELEYVSLNRDTTESDLKQRREIVGGSAVYFDQSAVRAATEGRILVLEGIEKAERNVLPVLNNLLENREMHLEDGRLLIPADRYDKLLQQYSKDELDKWKLVRVHEDFRVIALGLPVPRYPGNPLDPPLRSRFQVRDVHHDSYQEWLAEMKRLAPAVNFSKLEQLLSIAFTLLSKESLNLGLPDFPLDNLSYAAQIWDQNPDLSVYEIFCRLYPYKIFINDVVKHVETSLETFNVKPDPSFLKTILPIGQLFQKRSTDSGSYISNDYQNELINHIGETAKMGDLCLIGPKGCGKNIVVSQVAEILNNTSELIVLYQDMTSRDLIQQRTTLSNGDTIWKLSPLVNAALEGKIAILDGIHRINPSTLSILHRLIFDRELQLHDGKRLVRCDRFEQIQQATSLSEDELKVQGIFKIHPNFRIFALGEPPTPQSTGNWLSAEFLSFFIFHEIRMLSKKEELHIIATKYGPISESMQKIIDLAHTLRNNSDPILKQLSGHLTTRQLLRIAARLQRYPSNDVYGIIETTFMMKFLPSLTRHILNKVVEKFGIVETRNKVNTPIKYNVENDVVTIGSTSVPVYKTEQVSKVPNIVFYDIPQHLNLLEKMLQDFELGLHLLLVGNQGVGKNKIADRFLELLNRPREYIQLHRDTTIQTLTIQPTIRDGVLIYEDSPLVKAVKYGHVLVIDEADKAPIHVTSILKSLVESGQMILSDGRRITARSDPNNADCIEIHPDFRIIVLANRPGFPFLGNDFFGALGDLFSCHAVDNPSKESEILLLKQYGKNVSDSTIEKLVEIFSELRTMADQGLVNYPYSTREVVNIVKHLQKFPETDLEDAILNVFDFDTYSPEVVETLGQVLAKHGFPSSNLFTTEYLASKRSKERLQVTVDRKSGLDTKGPKHGKEDPNNDPHVGGNTWAGGTGGRDTAGLGGKGGPYRLDKGHKVHQLSDEEKAAVPEHIRKAAREMGKKAFEERLKEIGMSGYDATVYSQFSTAVSKQVQTLRIILSALEAKTKERHWQRHQTSGELDDIKLIDGLLGEKNVYRQRKDQQPEIGAPQMKPKLLRFVVDVSGSMYRFNSYDGRLDRELEAVVLVMESFEGYEDKILYDIVGHSGEAHDISFVKRKCYPKNNKERLDVLHIMHAHSQFCYAGDNTLEATELAVNSMAEEDCDEAIVVVLSDANLQRYGIHPSRLAAVLTAKPNVNAYVVFIGSLYDQAERLTQSLPVGRSFTCENVAELPQILKQIFSSSMMKV